MNAQELKELQIEWNNTQRKVYSLQKKANEKKDNYITELIKWGRKKGVDLELSEYHKKEVIIISNDDFGVYTLIDNPLIIKWIESLANGENLEKVGLFLGEE